MTDTVEKETNSPKNLIWIIVAVVVLAWYFRSDIATFTAAITPPDYKMSAISLMDAYAADEIAADLKYKDKIVVLTGRVLTKGKDVMGRLYVSYNVGRLTRSVECFFAPRYARDVSDVNSGRDLTIRGRVEGMTGNVVVRGCRIVGG